MKPINQLIAFSLLLATLCGCEEQSIMQPQPIRATDQVVANATPASLGGIIVNGPSLPSLTIVEQTYVPANDLFAHTRCRAWRITWPTYPVGTSPNLIPTMFSVAQGTPYSYNFLNNTAATNTYKTNFSLYHNNKLETVSQMWDELTHVLNAGQNLEQTRFNKSKFSVASIETWVKGRPELFELYWEDTIDTASEIKNYQKGDIYLFKLVNQKRYGGIRIVSMTPRIIEIYSAEPNK
ncbi:MAG: hypothetical protein LH609_21025 [Rudanella sp.]|nr:hypothetical protein [Rudanella sp.]